MSVSLLLGVPKLRSAAREGFTGTVSGVDLIVGARSGPLNLLLYSVFRVGDATANVSWDSYQLVANRRDVAWTIPISLGDSHRGFRVLGTDDAYFKHYRVAGGRRLAIREGQWFSATHEVVLGADVAEDLRYTPGQQIVIAHGAADVSFTQHDDQPFRVVGILERTGTPVDRTVHLSLDAIAALHDEDRADGASPAFLVGMRDRTAMLTMQRALNGYRKEPLLAIIPGVALKQLWDLVGIADRALMIVAAFVVFHRAPRHARRDSVSLSEHRREMAILRSVGAGPRHIFTLLTAEAGLLAALGVLLGIAMTYGLLLVAQPILADHHGIFVTIGGLSGYDSLLGAVIGAGLLMGLIPAWRAYRTSLADGLTIRV